jgi:hypothetical protein
VSLGDDLISKAPDVRATNLANSSSFVDSALKKSGNVSPCLNQRHAKILNLYDSRTQSGLAVLICVKIEN